MKSLVLLLLVVAAGIAPPAQAQVMLDVSKVTCDQWAGYKITNPQNIALWMSGYYNGKIGNTNLDTQALAGKIEKLRDFCITNPQLPVMQAVERLMAEH